MLDGERGRRAAPAENGELDENEVICRPQVMIQDVPILPDAYTIGNGRQPRLCVRFPVEYGRLQVCSNKQFPVGEKDNIWEVICVVGVIEELEGYWKTIVAWPTSSEVNPATVTGTYRGCFWVGRTRTWDC